MATDINEFRYLPAQAETLRMPFPHVERYAQALDDGQLLSSLRFSDVTPKITLLQGAGLNAQTWDTTVLTFSTPVLAIDLAGHGDLTWRDDREYSPRTLARDIAAALIAWGWAHRPWSGSRSAASPGRPSPPRTRSWSSTSPWAST